MDAHRESPRTLANWQVAMNPVEVLHTSEKEVANFAPPPPRVSLYRQCFSTGTPELTICKVGVVDNVKHVAFLNPNPLVVYPDSHMGFRNFSISDQVT